MDKNQPGPILTEAMIQNLCGSLSFGKGRTLYKNGKVLLADLAADGSRVEALVQDKLQSHVSVRAASGGRLEASCSSCPPLGSYVKGCKHVAAVLVAVKERLLGGGEEPGRRRSAGKKPSAGDKAPPSGVDKLLQLFAT
ncbi:SWIM zinc finger domain-containing protein, partial [Paenibacillus sp. P22]|uniref:SWIM zinc finger family protein n=1 Tax=Paenibacillus sp. P22 TaxID=483908 RepID=UPI0004350292